MLVTYNLLLLEVIFCFVSIQFIGEFTLPPDNFLVLCIAALAALNPSSMALGFSLSRFIEDIWDIAETSFVDAVMPPRETIFGNFWSPIIASELAWFYCSISIFPFIPESREKIFY